MLQTGRTAGSGVHVPTPAAVRRRRHVVHTNTTPTCALSCSARARREGTGPDSPRSRSDDRLPHHPSGSWPQASTHTDRHRSANTLHRGRPMHRSFAMQRSHDRATSQLAHLPTYALSDVGGERALRSARRSSPTSLQAPRTGESRHAQRARADGERVGRSNRTGSMFHDDLRRCRRTKIH